jgi:hypothetical protein
MSKEYENLKRGSKWKNVVTDLSVEGSRVLKYVTDVKIPGLLLNVTVAPAS